MKWFPLFFLAFLMSCEEKVPNYKKKNERQAEDARTSFKGVMHLNPKVRIDAERKLIEVTGGSGALCGINFTDGQVLTYDLINDDELQLDLGEETLNLKRIHHSVKDGVYGDWQANNFTEIESNRERIVTFIIRDQEVMDVDVYCEQKAID